MCHLLSFQIYIRIFWEKKNTMKSVFGMNSSHYNSHQQQQNIQYPFRVTHFRELGINSKKISRATGSKQNGGVQKNAPSNTYMQVGQGWPFHLSLIRSEIFMNWSGKPLKLIMPKPFIQTGRKLKYATLASNNKKPLNAWILVYRFENC